MKVILVILAFLGFRQEPMAAADLQNAQIVDVRTAQEFADSHLLGAVNIDILRSDFKSRIEKLDKNKKYFLYCRSGNRSGQAQALMKSLGFTNVDNLGSLGAAARKLQVSCTEPSSC